MLFEKFFINGKTLKINQLGFAAVKIVNNGVFAVFKLHLRLAADGRHTCMTAQVKWNFTPARAHRICNLYGVLFQCVRHAEIEAERISLLGNGVGRKVKRYFVLCNVGKRKFGISCNAVRLGGIAFAVYRIGAHVTQSRKNHNVPALPVLTALPKPFLTQIFQGGHTAALRVDGKCYVFVFYNVYHFSPFERLSAENMYMQVKHGLTGVRTLIYHKPVSVFTAVFRGYIGYFRQHTL